MENGGIYGNNKSQDNSEHTDGAITSYIRYNPDYSNPTSGCFYSRDKLGDPFTAIPPTDFTMYEPDDLEHVGWFDQNIEQIVTSVSEINDMTESSADSVSDIAVRSGEMRSANEDGYSKLTEAREAIGELVKIIGRFNWKGNIRKKQFFYGYCPYLFADKPVYRATLYILYSGNNILMRLSWMFSFVVDILPYICYNIRRIWNNKLINTVFGGK